MAKTYNDSELERTIDIYLQILCLDDVDPKFWEERGGSGQEVLDESLRLKREEAVS